MTASPFLSRRERFASVGSTNDIARSWLESGTPEVCLAVADEQTAGRGREGRSWTAPPGAGLLLSLGFRPTWLDPERTWRLAAIAALAMAEAAEGVAGLPAGAIGLKWPNDLVVAATLRKLGGLLGETVGLGTPDPRAIVGLGLNADWPAADFPPQLADTMTSLREIADGTAIDPGALLDGFLDRLEARTVALRVDRFDADGWAARQVTTGRTVRLEGWAGGSGDLLVTAVDPDGGGLIVDDPASAGGRRTVLAGEIVHLRLAPGSAGAGTAAGAALADERVGV